MMEIIFVPVSYLQLVCRTNLKTSYLFAQKRKQIRCRLEKVCFVRARNVPAYWTRTRRDLCSSTKPPRSCRAYCFLPPFLFPVRKRIPCACGFKQFHNVIVNETVLGRIHQRGHAVVVRVRRECCKHEHRNHCFLHFHLFFPCCLSPEGCYCAPVPRFHRPLR